MGLAVLPRYVADASVRSGVTVPLLGEIALPVQAMHAVLPSPALVPSKVTGFIAFLQQRWEQAAAR